MLRLEMLDRIYCILLALLRSEFYELEKIKEEYRLLVESRLRIMQCVAPLPPAIVSLVLDELEYQYNKLGRGVKQNNTENKTGI